MILETILNFIVLVIMGIISLFPTFPHFEFEELNGVISAISLVDSFVSLRVFGTCMAVILIVYNLRVVWAAVMWCVRKLPFIK